MKWKWPILSFGSAMLMVAIGSGGLALGLDIYQPAIRVPAFLLLGISLFSAVMMFLKPPPPNHPAEISVGAFDVLPPDSLPVSRAV